VEIEHDPQLQSPVERWRCNRPQVQLLILLTGPNRLQQKPPQIRNHSQPSTIVGLCSKKNSATDSELSLSRKRLYHCETIARVS